MRQIFSRRQICRKSNLSKNVSADMNVSRGQMRDKIVAIRDEFCLAIGLFSFNLAAQVIPRSIQEGGTDAALREKKNAWTVGIVGGLLSGTYMRSTKWRRCSTTATTYGFCRSYRMAPRSVRDPDADLGIAHSGAQ
jgi:hypothetical protein